MVGAGGTPKAASESRSASSWKMELVTGSHDFNVDGYSLVKGIGIGKFINSDAFVVGGYLWKIRFYPDGDRDTYKDYISVYLELLSDATDVKANFEATLFDQSGKGKHKKFRLFHVFGKTTSKSRGWGQFIERSDLEAFGYLKDDCLQFCGRVEVMQSSHADDSITVPQSNIIQHFGKLLESGEGVDVKFEVEGQTFSAHKLVLAARSPVFKAQFSGQMKDRRVRCIKVEDMEAPVFKALLHFIYWDDLPNLEVEEVESKQTSTMICGNLFAAANRYDLERLRLLCAAKLRDNMTIDTVANTLTLAEQHNCLPLKFACLKFIVQSNLQDAMERDDFKYLKETSPNLYIDMFEYISGINKHNIPTGVMNESDGKTEGVVNESVGNELKRRKI